MSIEDPFERFFYEFESIKGTWSVRELRRQMASNLYVRAGISKKPELLLDQLEDVKIQARSYAKMLGTRYSVIASQEKIWITSSKDDYSDIIFEETWGVLSDGDRFYELRKIIGKQ
ncbi:MAG: hypothetical protein K5770_09105 [Lachnospiraceae bacterium]|nr:hypothetical protein [Lachnospiraceae bacterium]